MENIIYKIDRYSTYEQDRFIVQGHPADIMDKLVRLAAKLTEYYASDIYYTLAEFQAAREANKPYDVLLGFREGGVETMTIVTNTKHGDLVSFHPGSTNLPESRNISQYWRVTHLPHATEGSTGEGRLYRVRLRRISEE